MPEKETSLFPLGPQPPTPEELQAMNPAEVQALIASGALDPSALPEGGVALQPGVYEAVPPNGVEMQQAAQNQLALVEKQAIDNHAHDQTQLSAPFMVEAAIHDKAVADARSEVARLFDSKTAQSIEETSLQSALGKSEAQTNDAAEIAKAYSHGTSPVAQIEQAEPIIQADNTKHAAEQFAGLKDKVNGKAEHLVRRVSERAVHRLRKLGIRGSKLNTVDAEVIEDNGANITKAGQAEAAVEAAVGNEVIHALGSGKPHASKELVTEIKAWRQAHPDKYRRLQRGVMGYRKGGQLSYRTRREVGKLFTNDHTAA